MLIETRIQNLIAGLDESQLRDAVTSACRAMVETRSELHEHVALQDVEQLKGPQIRYCVRGLATHAEQEYIYNYETRELFRFDATCSHVDLKADNYLRALIDMPSLRHGF